MKFLMVLVLMFSLMFVSYSFGYTVTKDDRNGQQKRIEIMKTLMDAGYITKVEVDDTCFHIYLGSDFTATDVEDQLSTMSGIWLWAKIKYPSMFDACGDLMFMWAGPNGFDNYGTFHPDNGWEE